MNVTVFLTQILFVLAFTYGAFRLGKEALTTSIALQAILANFFVLKQITFLGFEITASDAFAVGSILGLNLLREFFDRDSAKRAIHITFFFLIFFVIMAQVHLRFAPSLFDSTQMAYARLLSPTPRLLIASLISFYLVQQFDLRSFGWISKALPRSNFAYRSTLALAISQLLDTLLFSFMGLFGLVANLTHIILISFLIKLAAILAMSPLLTLFRRGSYRV